MWKDTWISIVELVLFHRWENWGLSIFQKSTGLDRAGWVRVRTYVCWSHFLLFLPIPNSLHFLITIRNRWALFLLLPGWSKQRWHFVNIMNDAWVLWCRIIYKPTLRSTCSTPSGILCCSCSSSDTDVLSRKTSCLQSECLSSCLQGHSDIYNILHGPHKIINLQISLLHIYLISSHLSGCLSGPGQAIPCALYSLQARCPQPLLNGKTLGNSHFLERLTHSHLVHIEEDQ